MYRPASLAQSIGLVHPQGPKARRGERHRRANLRERVNDGGDGSGGRKMRCAVGLSRLLEWSAEITAEAAERSRTRRRDHVYMHFSLKMEVVVVAHFGLLSFTCHTLRGGNATHTRGVAGHKCELKRGDWNIL